MPVFIDQTGTSIRLPAAPQRIVSIVPSQTELLYDLGLDKEVVGITRFCIHPDTWFRTKTRVGGTKQLKIDFIHSLQPDFIIANKEENVKEQVEELSTHYPVWTSDIHDLSSAYAMIEQVGIITGKQAKAGSIVSQIKDNFARLAIHHARPSTAYLIWQNPYMTVGGDTFIHHLLQRAGFDNIFSERSRYPEISIEDLQNSNCELLLLPSEPFPFKQKHIPELQSLLPHTRILLADGEMFSWYGSRLRHAPAYFEELQNQLLKSSDF